MGTMTSGRAAAPAAGAEWAGFQAAQRTALAAVVAGDPRPFHALWEHTPEVSLLGAFGGTACGWEQVRDRLEAVAAAYRDGVYRRFDLLAEHVLGDVAYTVHLEEIRSRTPGGAPEVRERRVTKVYRHGADGWRIHHMHADPLVTTDFPDRTADRPRGTSR